MMMTKAVGRREQKATGRPLILLASIIVRGAARDKENSR
jgi:hypothetical protein